MTTIRACATAARSPFSAAPAGPRPGGCRYHADPAPELNGPGERVRLDVVCDGRRTATVGLETHGGTRRSGSTGCRGTWRRSSCGRRTTTGSGCAG
ncbi:hypothetical protein ABZ370_13835 [Streptomyces sp. NPDC005962]|uniref:hypothetical protein n=1 Tax=Streptomyces sp. NPDC005962 TaxID=3154466 RepID=UPI0033CFAA12